MNFGGQAGGMEFHQLRYFVASADLLSISKAAEQLHVSQPALSRQIRLLEDELGVPLFDRIKKRIHLTEAGAAFLARARQILCDAETSIQQIREEFGGERRTLRLGFITPFLDDLVAPAVREFGQRHPKARVSLFDLPPRALLDRLANHELDLAVLGNLESGDHEEFDVRLLWKHRMEAVIPSTHRLAGRASVRLSELRSDTWISLSDAFFPGRRAFFLSICRRAGFDPRIADEMESIPVMLATIALGAGVGILPGHAKKLPHAGCVFLPVSSPVVSNSLFLVRSKETPGSELASLAALIEAHARELSRERAPRR